MPYELEEKKVKIKKEGWPENRRKPKRTIYQVSKEMFNVPTAEKLIQ
jgi:hypothetical protein